MGFLKAGFKNESDVSVEYWKIIDYHISVMYQAIDITYGGWVSKASRDANKAMVQQIHVSGIDDKYDQYFGTTALSAVGVNAVVQSYKYTKENKSGEFFKDASDI